MDKKKYLKYNGVPLKFAHVLENPVDDLVVFFSLKEAWAVFLEEIDEIVEQKIRS